MDERAKGRLGMMAQSKQKLIRRHHSCLPAKGLSHGIIFFHDIRDSRVIDSNIYGTWYRVMYKCI